MTTLEEVSANPEKYNDTEIIEVIARTLRGHREPCVAVVYMLKCLTDAVGVSMDGVFMERFAKCVLETYEDVREAYSNITIN